MYNTFYSGILATRIFRMDTKKLGKRIKIARIECDMIQQQLTEAAQTTQKAISRYELGLSMPPLDLFVKLSQVLQKPYSYFLDQ